MPRSPRFRRFAWALVAYNVAVILWGAYVRATGSGAGCGDHWPLCNGEVVPRSPSWHTLVEFSHRATSGLDVLLVLALAALALRLLPRGHRASWAAGAAVFFLLTEALVGAGLVHFDLVVDNDSMARAVVMAFHLVNTFFLLAALTLTAVWSGACARPRWRGRRGTVALLAGALAGVVVVGMSGAVTALGDTLFPARAFTWRDLSATSHLLLRLRIFHPAIALVVGLYLLLALARISALRPQAPVRRAAAGTAGLFLLQIAAGYVNVELAAPVPMQLVHLGLATVVWISLVVLAARALADGRTTPAEAAGP